MPRLRSRSRAKRLISRIMPKSLFGFRSKGLGLMSKIPGTLELQKICGQFSIPFDQAALYSIARLGKRLGKLRVEDFADADRILVRTRDDRREFVIKPATKQSLARTADDIKRFLKNLRRGSKFIVQRVGLKDQIESYGTLDIIKQMDGPAQVVYSEQSLAHIFPHSSLVFTTSPRNPMASFDTKQGRLGPEAKNFLNEKIGRPKAHEMVEHILGRIKPKWNYTAELRFVKYKGKKPRFFYDMTVNTTIF